MTLENYVRNHKGYSNISFLQFVVGFLIALMIQFSYENMRSNKNGKYEVCISEVPEEYVKYSSRYIQENVNVR